MKNKKEVPTVSIIMPAYNAEKYLKTAVDSVIAQTFKDWELVIIDDCSKDNSRNLIQSYAMMDVRIRYIYNEQNKGASAARHVGVLSARGKWLAFLDVDDAWEQDKLELQLDLVNNSNAKLVFTASAFMDNDGNRLDYILHVPKTIKLHALCKQNLISNSSVMVNRKLFLKYEIVGEGMHEDFACWINILKHGYKAYGIDKPLLIYRLSEDSKSANKFKAAKMNWNTYMISGINPLQASYYMCWYTAKGVFKYKNLVIRKKKNIVSVIGHFGGNEVFLDGQTIKTKVLFTELEDRTNWDLLKIDTYEKRKHPVNLFLNSVKSIVKADAVIVMVHENGNKVYFPLLYLAAKYMKKPVFHDVIGGDLPAFVDSSKNYQKYLNSFCANWVETEKLKKALEERGVTNCHVIPNFKKLDIYDSVDNKISGEVLRMCTFSRVIKEKGIEDAIMAVEDINKKAGKIVCTLDIYGQIGKEYTDAFEKIMNASSTAVTYKGLVDYTEGTAVLGSYDILLFPTYWIGECFPGTIVDAFSAGCPVIASDWNSNGEIITSGKNGIIYPGSYGRTLEDAIMWALHHPSEMEEMGRNAYLSCKDFSAQTIMPEIIRMIEKGLKR